MTSLSVSGLCKVFGSHVVLADLGVSVPAGSLTAVLCPSCSGKTTLRRILAGVERADAGTVTIGDAVVDGPGAYLPPERRRIGYVPQEGSLFPHLTVAANVGFGLPARQRKGPRTVGLLDAVGLAGLGRRYPHQLSGGQQQRVALATADRVAVLRDGKIAQCASPEDLYLRPVDADLARFIGDANLVDGVLDGTTVHTILGRLPVEASEAPHPPPGPVTVLIRPEQVELQPAGAASLAGRVVSCGYHGHDAVVHVQPEQDGAAQVIIVRIAGGRQLPAGSPVSLRTRGPVLA